jgi:hypothetical protein
MECCDRKSNFDSNDPQVEPHLDFPHTSISDCWPVQCTMELLETTEREEEENLSHITKLRDAFDSDAKKTLVQARARESTERLR